MEVLLIACMLAYAAGAQSEQSKLGLHPGQRAVMRENTRHEKAVRKIADKHGIAPAGGDSGVSPWKEPHGGASAPAVTLPEAFRGGYRGSTPVQRVATPVGRQAGDWAARGVGWARDTGRGALRQYRRRRRSAGHDDPAPVLVPLPPNHPPAVPPMPTQPPTVGAANKGGVSLAKPAAPQPPGASAKPAVTSPPVAPTAAPPAPTAPALVPPPVTSAPAPAQPATTAPPANTTEGVGRMAAEVSYESVMDESDELSLMCDDDVRVYGRIHDRCEREIGRADALIANMEAVGFGPGPIGWVVRAKEKYQAIYSQLDELQTNTIAQGEKVVQAKAYLEAGQGVYADIAKDMESVADREVYISDAVDAEDTNAHTEVYETRGA